MVLIRTVRSGGSWRDSIGGVAIGGVRHLWSSQVRRPGYGRELEENGLWYTHKTGDGVFDRRGLFHVI